MRKNIVTVLAIVTTGLLLAFGGISVKKQMEENSGLLKDQKKQLAELKERLAEIDEMKLPEWQKAVNRSFGGLGAQVTECEAQVKDARERLKVASGKLDTRVGSLEVSNGAVKEDIEDIQRRPWPDIQEVLHLEQTLSELMTADKQTLLLKREQGEVMSLGYEGSARGFLRILDAAGNLVALIGGDELGGFLKLNGVDRRVAVIGPSVPGGGGRLELFNTADRAVVELGSDGSRSGILTLRSATGNPIIELASENGFQDRPRLSFFNEAGVVLQVGPGLKNGFICIDDPTVGDYAEGFASRVGKIRPGSVVAALFGFREGIDLSQEAYDSRVLGVVSGAGGLKPAVMIEGEGANRTPVALAGQVYVRVDLEGGNIYTGDLLVSSSTAGVAMKGSLERIGPGMVIGKALESFQRSKTAHSEGLVRMLVMNR